MLSEATGYLYSCCEEQSLDICFDVQAVKAKLNYFEHVFVLMTLIVLYRFGSGARTTDFFTSLILR